MDLSHLDGYAVSYSYDEYEAYMIQRAVKRTLAATGADERIECRLKEDSDNGSPGYFIELAVRSDQ